MHAPERPAPPDPEMYLLLGRIDGKLDQTLAQLMALQSRHSDLEVRVSALEKAKAYLLGAAAIIAAAINLLTHKLTAMLSGGP